MIKLTKRPKQSINVEKFIIGGTAAMFVAGLVAMPFFGIFAPALAIVSPWLFLGCIAKLNGG